jgi:uncharacterized membrane protein YczE
MTSAGTARRNPLPGVPWALAGGTYFALFGFVILIGTDWVTRALVGLLAMLPVLVVATLVGVWRLMRGPAHWSFSRLHWILFFMPTAALLVLAAAALMTGRSLS